MPITNPSTFGVVSNKTSKRFAFELRDQTQLASGPELPWSSRAGSTIFYPFKLNPQEYSVSLPSRVNATQTKGGVFIDDFGLGIGVITIRGFTIFADHSSRQIVAIDELKKLRDTIYLKFFDNRKPGEAPTTLMYFYNFTDNDYFRVIPYVFKLERNAQKPHQFTYNIGLYIIDNATTPVSPTTETLDKNDYTFGASQMMGGF